MLLFFIEEKLFTLLQFHIVQNQNKGSDADPSAERSLESLECPEPLWGLGAPADAQHISDYDSAYLGRCFSCDYCTEGEQ